MENSILLKGLKRPNTKSSKLLVCRERIPQIYMVDHMTLLLYSLPKTIEPSNFSFILSNVVVDIVRVRINAIRFIFFEADIRNFEVRITAWRKRNWHFSYGFQQTV